MFLIDWNLAGFVGETYCVRKCKKNGYQEFADLEDFFGFRIKGRFYLCEIIFWFQRYSVFLLCKIVTDKITSCTSINTETHNQECFCN